MESTEQLSQLIQYLYPFVVSTSAAFIIYIHLDRKLLTLRILDLNNELSAEQLVEQNNILVSLNGVRKNKYALLNFAAISFTLVTILTCIGLLIIAACGNPKIVFKYICFLAFFLNWTLIGFIILNLFGIYEYIHLNVHPNRT